MFQHNQPSLLHQVAYSSFFFFFFFSGLPNHLMQ
jgi:hypothetical protein